MIFGDGVGASPVRGPYCQLAGYFVWRWCVSTLEQLSWRRCLCGLKTGPPRRHRIQPVEGPVLDPLAKETCFQKGSKSGPLEIKSGPPWRVQVWSLFWHLHCRKFVEALISSWSWFDQQQLRLESWTGEVHFCAPAFSYVLRTKTGTFFVTLFSPISTALRPSRPASRPASKLAPKCFVLIPMVSRRWSSRLALRPASNYTSSSKLFVWLQFPYPWGLEACVEAVSLRQLRPKILARQHSCQLLQVQLCWDFNNSII